MKYSIDSFYVGKPINLPHLEGSFLLDGRPEESLLDPHPDFLWYDQYGEAHSVGTSLFLGPQTPRYAFSEQMPLYCPESVKWNRLLYYAMDEPRLFDPIPNHMKLRILQRLTVYPYSYDGIETNLIPTEIRSKFVIQEKGPYALDFETNKFSLSGIGGVWSLWGRCNSNGPMRCLDIHECVDLAYEMETHHQCLVEARKRCHDDDYFYETTDDRSGTTLFGIKYGPGEVFSLERRSKAISNWRDLEIRLVAYGLGWQPGDKFLRELVEAQLAWEWKAVYWNRTYFQAVTQRMVKSQLQVENVMKKK